MSSDVLSSKAMSEESDPLSDGPILRAEDLLDDDETPELVTDLARLGPGSSFGELALLLSKPRMSTIKCMSRCHFMVLSKKDFKKGLEQIEYRKLIEKINFIRELPLFSRLTRTYLSKFTYSFKELTVNKDKWLYKED